ncbi:hypothetical protein ACFL35_03855 [Candidatus Riflebacteria bacterium]
MKKLFIIFLIIFSLNISALNATGFPETIDARTLNRLQGLKSLHLEASYYPQERHLVYINSFTFPVYFSKLGSYPNRARDIQLLHGFKDRYLQMRTGNFPRSGDVAWLNRYMGIKSLYFLSNRPNDSAIKYIQQCNARYLSFVWSSYPNGHLTQKLQKLQPMSLKFKGRFPEARDVRFLNTLPIENLSFGGRGVPYSKYIVNMNNLKIGFMLYINKVPLSSEIKRLEQLTGMEGLVIILNNVPTSSDIRRLNDWGKSYSLGLIMERPYPGSSYQLRNLNALTGCKKIVFKGRYYPTSYQERYLNALHNRAYSIWIVPSLARDKGIITSEGIQNLDLEDQALMKVMLPRIKRSGKFIHRLFKHRLKFEGLHSLDAKFESLLNSYQNDMK